jgi:hypothetical protein
MIMIQSLMASNTFEVSEVALATKPLRKWPYPKAVSAFLSRPIEACSKYDGELVANVGNHSLIVAMHLAYGKHYPLVLSPDILWLTITQGLAQHIKKNAEIRINSWLSNHNIKSGYHAVFTPLTSNTILTTTQIVRTMVASNYASNTELPDPLSSLTAGCRF